jgi:2-methylisocitrate lyase-like PEP mutase family enzyme
VGTSGELREMLLKGGLIVAPGAYDCVTARLIEQAGFAAVYMTGAGTAASRLGVPDYGLITMTEMVANAGAIAAAVRVPVIADADTGYGNELNVVRTVREFERHGVAGIHIEDQAFPKKCGHLERKEIIPQAQFLAKINAAASERHDPDFVIIARTDAIAVEGFEEAIARANAALEQGADVAFVEAPQTEEQLRAIPRLVEGPCLLNIVHGGKSPEITLKQAREFGYRIAILPTMLLTAVIETCEKLLQTVSETAIVAKPERGMTIRELFERFGAQEWDQLQSRYKV